MEISQHPPLSTCLGVVCGVEDGAGAEAHPREAAGHPPRHVLDVGDPDAGLRHAVEEPVSVPRLLQLLADHPQHPGDEPGIEPRSQIRLWLIYPG